MVRGWPVPEGLIDHPLKRIPDDMRTERLEVQPAKSRYATLALHRVAPAPTRF